LKLSFFLHTQRLNLKWFVYSYCHLVTLSTNFNWIADHKCINSLVETKLP